MEKAGALLLLSHSDEPGPAREELKNSIIANNGVLNPIDKCQIKIKVQIQSLRS